MPHFRPTPCIAGNCQQKFYCTRAKESEDSCFQDQHETHIMHAVDALQLCYRIIY